MQQSPASSDKAHSALPTGLDFARSLGPITFIGQSHVECMRDALLSASDQISVVNLWHLSNPMLANELPALEAMPDLFRGIVVSVLIGSAFESLTMFRHPRPFDFVSPFEPDTPLEPDVELIPFEAVRQAILSKIAHNLSLVERLRQLTGGVLLQVEPPPVWGDQRAVADWPTGGFEPTGEFGPRHLRRKASRVHSEIMRLFCAERGIKWVSAPPETMDDEGFLKREYSKDLVHGTEAYGTLLAERVLRRIAEMSGL